MIVIGGGLGGLFCAALAGRDHDVLLFEKSPTLGGRFRNIVHEGYSLTTGALHMVPHGSSGPVSTILSRAGADCQIVDSRPWATFLLDGKEKRFHVLRKEFPVREKMGVARLIMEMKYTSGNSESVGDLLCHRFDNPLYHSMAKCFLGWSLSAKPSDVPTHDMFAIVKNTFKFGGPGVPVGGCSGVISALLSAMPPGVRIMRAKVVSIVVEEGAVKGVVTDDGTFYEDSLVISDMGVKKTVGCCPKNEIPSDYRKRVDALRPSGGIKINISADKSLIGHTGVLFPLDAEKVEGVIQPTNVDPSLAPEGKELLMSHQTLTGKNIRREISQGIADLEEIFKGKEFSVINAQTYYGANPVNHASQGQDFSPQMPVDGLYLVGDGVKGLGGIEVEGIAMGVLSLMRELGVRPSG